MSLREKHDRQEKHKRQRREPATNKRRAGVCGRRGPLGRQIERLCETTAQFTAVGFYGQSEVCTVALQTGGLHFCRIFTLRIFSLSLSLSLLILAAHGLTLQMKSVSFGTNFSFHSSPLPVLGSVFSFILANISRPKCYLQRNFFFGNKWGQVTTLWGK